MCLECFEKEIVSLLRKMEAKRARNISALGKKRKLSCAFFFEGELRKLECSFNYGCSNGKEWRCVKSGWELALVCRLSQ